MNTNSYVTLLGDAPAQAVLQQTVANAQFVAEQQRKNTIKTVAIVGVVAFVGGIFIGRKTR